jgi:RNA recognition motif-containing protein
MELYVSNLNPGIEENELTKLFSSFGPTLHVKLIRDRITGISRCFGFVSMLNPGDAEKAMEEMNGLLIGGREIIVQKSIPRDKNFTGEQAKNSTAPKRTEVQVKDEGNFIRTILNDGTVRVKFKD